jgi:hypothetical protein
MTLVKLYKTIITISLRINEASVKFALIAPDRPHKDLIAEMLWNSAI